MPAVDGKLLNLDLVVKIWGIQIAIKGTVEVLDIRKRLDNGMR